MTSLRVALVQMDIEDGVVERNLTRAGDLIDAHPGAQLYLLPELWSSGYVHDQWPVLAKDTTPGVLESLRRIAKRHGATIGGTLISLNDHAQLVNRFWLVGEEGVLGCYDKAHLFAPMDEPKHLTPGSRRQRLPVGEWTAALSICYDLRFPALYQALSAAGATVLAIPAAFTRPTGAAHWHVLMRARAIESAAFVVAAAQTGEHEDGRATYGHSLVVDPWGEVLLDMGEDAGIGFAELDPDRIADVRSRIPVIDHRRPIPPVERA